MGRTLIRDNVNSKLDELVTKLFLGNRICDRAMSVLDLKFAMNKTVEVLHPKLAHLFPALADVVSEYQGSRNALTVYGITPLDSSDYARPLDFFDRMIEFMVDVESLCHEICGISMEEDDSVTRVFIDSFILKLMPVTKQCLVLADKSEAYGNDLMSFDSRIEDWITI